MQFCLNGVSNRSKLAVINRTSRMMYTRIGTWKVIGMTDVSKFLIFIGHTSHHSLKNAVPPADTKFYRSPFLRDFWHLNIAMMTSNNALIPDPDKEDILASSPTDWPLMHLGLRMCGWADSQIKYYLLGTPVIWWAGAVSLVLSLFVLGVYLLRMQRKYKDFEPSMSCQFNVLFQ